MNQPTSSIEKFFFNDPTISSQNPWKPLPRHPLELSPCYPIIGIHNKYNVRMYFCRLHPQVQNNYLESIEHHCRFSDPQLHKSEILKFLEKCLSERS